MSVPDNFDWEIYCTMNRDLWKAGIRTEDSALNHWKNYGNAENRSFLFAGFDWMKYNESLDNKFSSRVETYNHYFEHMIMSDKTHNYDIDDLNNRYSNINTTDDIFKKYKDTTKICVIMHVGYDNIIDELLDCVSNFNDIKIDLWITISESCDNIDSVQLKLNNIYPDSHVFIVPNKGFDIGPFFYILRHMMTNNIDYDIYIKLHTKKTDKWRKKLYGLFMGSHPIILNNIKTIDNDNIGGLFVDSYSYDKIKDIYFKSNEYHFNRIIEKIYGMSELSDDKYMFNAGTMFWIKGNILKKVFSYDILNWIDDNMNDSTTYDVNWMKINNESSIGNLLWKDIKNKNYIRDGMFEHSLERFLGCIILIENYQIKKLN
jgi:lipopolysaccharide biosynthesis protein